jgi:isoprenylcysteine carboxyl methyltransferase (ICMT) family protein YpbQ
MAAGVTIMRGLVWWLPIVAVVAIYGLRLFELSRKRNTIPGIVREHLTLRLFFLAGTIIFLGSVIEYLLRGKELSWPLFVLGIALAIISFWLRRKAIAALGKFWSLHVEIREQHQFVQHGPFRYLRHPTYLSMILELVALALICRAFITLLAIPVLFLPVLAVRLHVEESALTEKFGETYRHYQQTTPALFPWKW